MTMPGGRSAALNSARNLKMARSARAYVRGSTVKFYEWLEAIEAQATSWSITTQSSPV